MGYDIAFVADLKLTKTKQKSWLALGIDPKRYVDWPEGFAPERACTVADALADWQGERVTHKATSAGVSFRALISNDDARYSSERGTLLAALRAAGDVGATGTIEVFGWSGASVPAYRLELPANLWRAGGSDEGHDAIAAMLATIAKADAKRPPPLLTGPAALIQQQIAERLGCADAEAVARALAQFPRGYLHEDTVYTLSDLFPNPATLAAGIVHGSAVVDEEWDRRELLACGIRILALVDPPATEPLARALMASPAIHQDFVCSARAALVIAGVDGADQAALDALATTLPANRNAPGIAALVRRPDIVALAEHAGERTIGPLRVRLTSLVGEPPAWRALQPDELVEAHVLALIVAGRGDDEDKRRTNVIRFEHPDSFLRAPELAFQYGGREALERCAASFGRDRQSQGLAVQALIALEGDGAADRLRALCAGETTAVEWNAVSCGLNYSRKRPLTKPWEALVRAIRAKISEAPLEVALALLESMHAWRMTELVETALVVAPRAPLLRLCELAERSGDARLLPALEARRNTATKSEQKKLDKTIVKLTKRGG